MRPDPILKILIAIVSALLIAASQLAEAAAQDVAPAAKAAAPAALSLPPKTSPPASACGVARGVARPPFPLPPYLACLYLHYLIHVCTAPYTNTTQTPHTHTHSKTLPAKNARFLSFRPPLRHLSLSPSSFPVLSSLLFFFDTAGKPCVDRARPPPARAPGRTYYLAIQKPTHRHYRRVCSTQKHHPNILS